MYQFWNFVAQIEADHLQVEEITDQVQDHLQVEEITDGRHVRSTRCKQKAPAKRGLARALMETT